MSSFTIPDFGLGIWKIPKDKTETIVYEAIKLGVRHIDSACDYGNEREAGRGIAKVFKVIQVNSLLIFKYF